MYVYIYIYIYIYVYINILSIRVYIYIYIHIKFYYLAMQVSVGLLQEEVKHYLEMVLEVVEVKMMIQSASMHTSRWQANVVPWTLLALMMLKRAKKTMPKGGTLHRQLMELTGWILTFLNLRICHI